MAYNYGYSAAPRASVYPGAIDHYSSSRAPSYERRDHHVKMPPSHHTVHREGHRWSWCSMIWTALASFFCCAVCGMVGVAYAILSYVDHKSGDHYREAYKRKCAWGWFIAAVIFGIIVIVGVVLFYTLYYAKLVGTTFPTWP